MNKNFIPVIVAVVIISFVSGLYFRSTISFMKKAVFREPSGVVQSENQGSTEGMVVFINASAKLSSLVNVTGRPCYENSEIRLDTARISNGRVLVDSVFTNGSKTEHCGYDQQVVRMVDDKGAVFISEFGPADSVLPSTSDAYTLRFKIADSTKVIKIVVGAPNTPDAAYVIDFQRKTAEKIKEATVAAPFIRVISPKGGEMMCFGKPFDIKWESNGVKIIKLFLVKNGFDSVYPIGEGFPSNFNEEGKEGYGTYSWTVGDGMEVTEGYTYQIMAQGRALDPRVPLINNTSDIFSIQNCQG